MDESLQTEATQSADEITSALRQQRERARKFVSQWRESVGGIEKDLFSQLEATMRDLSAAADNESTGTEEVEQRSRELAELQERLNQRAASSKRRSNCSKLNKSNPGWTNG